jgi:hypothetical protein
VGSQGRKSPAQVGGRGVPILVARRGRGIGILDALQHRIDEKDKPEKVKGGPYDRYILVIVTDEFTLNRHTIEAFLAEDKTIEGFNIGMNSGGSSARR